MQTLEVLSRRIESAEQLRSIVRTMKAMAAANIRQCQLAVASLAEYGRTVEMGLQAAEKSIEERLEGLLAQHHQLRQSAVTEELLDVVAGFEALAGNRAA